MKIRQTEVSWPKAIFEVLVLLLVLLMGAPAGWGSEEKKKPQANSLSDQEVIRQVKDLLKSDPAFIDQLVAIVPSKGQRTLLVSFKGSRGISENLQSFEAAANLLKGLLAGGGAALLARKPIHSVTVLVLGGERNLAFRASVPNIGKLLSGSKTPENFIQNDLLMVNLDEASRAK